MVASAQNSCTKIMDFVWLQAYSMCCVWVANGIILWHLCRKKSQSTIPIAAIFFQFCGSVGWCIYSVGTQNSFLAGSSITNIVLSVTSFCILIVNKKNKSRENRPITRSNLGDSDSDLPQFPPISST